MMKRSNMMTNHPLSVKEKYHLCINSILSNSKEKRLRALETLISLLSAEANAKEYFYYFRGTEVLINQFTHEIYKSVAQSILFALACSADGHASNKMNLQNDILLKYMYEILRHPNILKFPTFLSCSLMMILSLVSQNSVGQNLIKKHGCLTQMISIFEDFLMLVKEEKTELKESIMVTWEILCKTLGASVNNPINAENQLEVSLLFPKVLDHLTSLNYSNERAKKQIHSYMNFLMLAISGNKYNQCSFATYGGIQLIKNYKLFENEVDVLQTCLMVLDVAVVSNDQCFLEASKQDIMPFLLGILRDEILINNVPLILLLCHLLQTDDESFKSFKAYNGLMLIQECIKGGSENRDLEFLVKCLLQFCLQRESKTQSNVSQESKSPDLFIEEGINLEGSKPKDVSSGRPWQPRANRSELTECETTKSERDNQYSKSKTYSVFEPGLSFTISSANRPQITKGSSYKDTPELNRSFFLPSVHHRENTSKSTCHSLHSGNLNFNFVSTPQVDVAKTLKTPTKTLASDSEIPDTCCLSSSLTGAQAEKFSETKRCHKRDRCINPLSLGSKLRMHQAKNLSHKNQLNVHGSHKFVMVTSGVDKHKHMLQNDKDFIVPTSMSRRKRSYSLINEATPNKSPYSESMCHSLPQKVTGHKRPPSNFNAPEYIQTADETFKKSDPGMVAHVHVHLNLSEAKIDASPNTSGGQGSNKISPKYRDMGTCKSDNYIGSAYSVYTSNMSPNVTKMTAPLKPHPHNSHSTLSPSIDTSLQDLQNETTSGSVNAHQNKITPSATNGSQEQLVDLSNLSRRVGEVYSSSYQPVNGKVCATLSPIIEVCHKQRDTISTGHLENPKLRVITPSLTKRSQNDPLDLSISSSIGIEVVHCSSPSVNGAVIDTLLYNEPGSHEIEKTILKENSKFSHDGTPLVSKQFNLVNLSKSSIDSTRQNPHTSQNFEGTVSLHPTFGTLLPYEHHPQVIKKTNLKEKIEISRCNNPVNLSKPLLDATKLNSHISPGNFEGTISLHSTTEVLPLHPRIEVLLPCKTTTLAIENTNFKETEFSKNNTQLAPKQWCPLYLKNSSNNTTEMNSHHLPSCSQSPLPATSCSQMMPTKSNVTNFEILLFTPHSTNQCQINALGLHHTSDKANEVNSKSSCDSNSGRSSSSLYNTPTTDNSNSTENNELLQNKTEEGIPNNPIGYSSNPHLLVGDGISNLDSSPNSQANETVLNAKDIEKTSIADKVSLASMLKKRRENIRKSSLIPKGVKRRLNAERDSIKQIPLSLKEVENLQAGIKKFGLHFGAIRKSYPFIPKRTSKDLFLAWKELNTIIRHPAEHKVNQNMLDVSSDEALTSE